MNEKRATPMGDVVKIGAEYSRDAEAAQYVYQKMRRDDELRLGRFLTRDEEFGLKWRVAAQLPITLDVS